MLKVRRAVIADATAIGAVHVEAWRTAYASLLPAAVLDALDAGARGDFWRALLARGDDPPFVAENEAGIVGFGHFRPCPDDDLDPATSVEVSALYVAAGSRGEGIGARLLGAGIDAARAVDARELSLWVLAGNTGARRFYARHGFAADGRTGRVAELGDVDELRMRRALDVSSPP